MEPQWIVRRIRTVSGLSLVKPKLWGIVRAPSESIAVMKFAHITRLEENKDHFDAVRYKEER